MADQWAAVLAVGEAKFGKVNVLINNAGIIGAISATADLSEPDYQKVYEVNQLGTYLGMKAVIPPMMAAATDEGGGDALSMIPLNRLADPSEVSSLCVFLASDESAFITGH